MLKTDYTTKLLGLEDCKITNIENNSNEVIIHLEMERKLHSCPYCKRQTKRIHNYRTQRITKCLIHLCFGQFQETTSLKNKAKNLGLSSSQIRRIYSGLDFPSPRILPEILSWE